MLTISLSRAQFLSPFIKRSITFKQLIVVGESVYYTLKTEYQLLFTKYQIPNLCIVITNKLSSTFHSSTAKINIFINTSNTDLLSYPNFIFFCLVRTLSIIAYQFVLFLLTFVLSVVFRFTASGDDFGIFKLFANRTIMTRGNIT